MNKEMILDVLNSRYCCLKEPSADLYQAYDRRHLTSLRVYGTREDDEPQSPQTLSQNIIDPRIVKKKITATISALLFRDPHVLVQFWSPVTVRKRCWLTTLDQPFGIGLVNEALYNYRLESEQSMFVVDGEHREELGGSPGRVYRQKLPEWSLDNGYISLPVVDPASGCCVGVLELITSSKHADYVFEVKEISKALKEQDLKTSNAFEEPSFCPLPSEDWQIQIAKIKDILKVMCDTHNLALAQTWELSPLGSHVLHEKCIQKSCSSFNCRCIGKVCMSTAGLPFYIRDLSMWEFHEACMMQHLEKSRGVVGTALLSQGASYCENVTKLSEEEYPLVHNACKSGLGGCFAIYLRGIEGKNDYILEFFMPLVIKDSIDSYVRNLVQKLKLKIQEASGFETGDLSSIEVIRPPSVVNNISSMTEVDTPDGIIPHPLVTNIATIASGAYANVSMQKTRDKGNDAGEPSNRSKRKIKCKRDSITLEAVAKQAGKPMEEAHKSLGVSRSTFKRSLRAHNIPRWINSKHSNRSACVTDSNQHLAESKRKLEDRRAIAEKKLSQSSSQGNKEFTNEAKLLAPQHWNVVNLLGYSGSHEKPLVYKYADNLCFEVDTPNGIIPHPFVTNVATTAYGAYANVSRQKARDKGNDAGEPSNRLNKKRKIDSLKMEVVVKLFGQPMDEACKSLEVSRSTLKRFLRNHYITRWPVSKLGTLGRVYHQKLRELRDIPTSQNNKNWNANYNIHGYILLPVYFNGVCIGTLELIMSAHYSDNVDASGFEMGDISSKPTLHVYHVAKLILCLRRWKKRSLAHQDVSLVFENTTDTEQATNNVDPLMGRTAMAHQDVSLVFENTTDTEQATNNVDPLMDVDVTDLYLVDTFPTSADFIDDQGSFLKMAGCSSDSVLDYPMEPAGIENPMAEIGMGQEGALFSPIGSGDMYSFGANPSEYDFSNPAFDYQLFY